MSQSNEVVLSFNRVLLNPDEPPKPVHRVVWTRVGTEILFDVGHVDLVELRGELQKHTEGKEPGTVSLFVTDRFHVTPQGALELLESVQSLVRNLRDDGILPAEEGD